MGKEAAASCGRVDKRGHP